jgi:uncharacterized membrane protein
MSYKMIAFNILAFTVMIAEQYGYTGATDETVNTLVPFVMLGINAIAAFLKRRASKKDA